MEEIKNYRELFYPAEWAFRLIIISMLIMVLEKLYPGQLGLSGAVIYCGVLVGAVIAIIIQVIFLFRWMDD